MLVSLFLAFLSTLMQAIAGVGKAVRLGCVGRLDSSRAPNAAAARHDDAQVAVLRAHTHLPTFARHIAHPRAAGRTLRIAEHRTEPQRAR